MSPGGVLHVVAAGEVGGAERMLVDLAGSTERPHAVALFTPNPRLRALFAGLDVIDRGDVRDHALATLRRSLGRSDVAWLADLVRARGSRIVHLHTFGSQVVGTRAALRAGVAVVRTEHSTRVYDDPSCWPFSRWSLARAQRAVCVSRFVAEVAARKAPWAQDQLAVVHNGVDTARFTAPAAVLAGPLRLLAVGRLDARKGLDRALAALRAVPEAALEIVGDGPERAALERLAASLGLGNRVQFTGYCEDVRPAITRADAVLSASRQEGLGVALLEAMAMRRPVVALPTGGIPELFGPGTGWLADGHDEVALVRALRRASAERAEIPERGEKARARVEREFSVTAMRAAYERIYAALG